MVGDNIIQLFFQLLDLTRGDFDIGSLFPVHRP